MMRLVGAALVVGGCLWIGNYKVKLLHRYTVLLEGLEGALRALERELSLRPVQLATLLETISRQFPGAVGTLFSRCREGLDVLGEKPFAQLWREEVEGLPGLREEDRRLLLSLGPVLGRYDADGQARAIVSVTQGLEERSHLAREELRRVSGVYRAVGAVAGAFLVILLL